jgi:hypothetical protein
MAERLVDILDGNGQVLHTYPVTVDGNDADASEAEYLAKALQAASHGQLVPNDELPSLTARMHRDQGGQLQPFGDTLSSNSETKVALEQEVRERAYYLWDADGRPEGRGEEYWHRALDQHLRERAYVLWEQEGSPEGGADEYWKKLRDFQAY